MSALSWNEIRQNAIQFSREWEGARKDERAEAQTFWNEFFKVFGLKRQTIAAFEEKVKSVKDTYHRIDVFVPGKMLAEHKSLGESLDKAHSQAFDYVLDLYRNGRENEVPRYIVLCDFNTFVLYDLAPDEQMELPLWRDKPYNRLEFPVAAFHAHIKHFAFLIGQKTHKFAEEDPANLEAAQIMADLHDVMELGGYPQKDLERLLVRLLFCLFADDTGIFEPSQFELYIENRTNPDASNLGQEISSLFDILNTPFEQRSKHISEDLAAFRYVNGELFAAHLSPMGFNRDMRNRLLAACHFDWSRISPAIFGSLFQGIMDSKERRQIGAHFTTERDIMKVIRPLFLDDLQSEFEQLKKSRSTRRKADLQKFQDKLAKLKFLDPACGCGNFLVVSYRELRKLELEVLKTLYDFDKRGKELEFGEVSKLSKVDVNQFFGIEIMEWPSRIAETALWLTDHQMNTELTLATGNFFQRIPLKESPHIRCANALRMDWNELLPAKECSYVLGNPPFVGKKEQNADQKIDHELIWDKIKGAGILDYVTCWYVQACVYIKGRNIPCAFVSTNSITQGEQVGVLWSRLLSEFQLKIHFAHNTFAWVSEAKGAAHVHVVIIGFGAFDVGIKRLFSYETPKAEPVESIVSNINPYLADAPNVIIRTRTKPISNAPSINYGSMMIDKSRTSGTEEGLIIDDDERRALLRELPEIKGYIKKIYGGEEFINGSLRWCLWLDETAPLLMRKSERLKKRIDGVKKFRLGSSREATKKLAETPYLFGERRQPTKNYVFIPKVSSESRQYIPMGFLPPSIIASGSALVFPNAKMYHFGILSSAMHMGWTRTVCGRLESRYQYSSGLVYNNFPWPQNITPEQMEKVENCAKHVLEIREKYIAQGANLADMYAMPMPGDLLKAHHSLDAAVDKCYRGTKFNSERERVEYLFGLYEKLTSPLTAGDAPKKKRGVRKK